MSNWKKPAWYLTPEEFAKIIVDSLEENNYFKHDEKAHPVDIEAAFSTTASAIAHAIDAIGKKMYEEEKQTEKQAMMMPKDLKKNSITVTSSDNVKVVNGTTTFGDDIDYLEHKYGKIKK
jgi:hypothetical protein